MSSFRFYSNSVCCALMVATTAADLAMGLYYEALFCAIVALFTGFNAWIEAKLGQS